MALGWLQRNHRKGCGSQQVLLSLIKEGDVINPLLSEQACRDTLGPNSRRIPTLSLVL